MKTPFLAGKKIYLRGISEREIAPEGPYFQWFNDQEVCRQNSHGRFPNSDSKMRRYFEQVVQSENNLVLGIFLKEENAHIGNVSLLDLNWVDRTGEFAVILGEKSCWGKGFSKEAASLIVEHGFTELNLNRIYCGTTAENVGMQKLAASLGMKPEGTRRQAVYRHGKYLDVLEYGLLRTEFHGSS